MRNIFKNIIFLFLLLLASCTDQEIASNRSDLPKGTYRFTVTIPEAIEATTRTLGETPQDVMRMSMRVLVFDENGFFVAYEVATVESFDDASQKGTYTVNLPVRDDITTLHFVLGLDDADYGGTFTPSDSEASIFSQLTVSGGKDAYWQRISVGDINKNTQLPTVHLVRNFAKITVKTSQKTPSNFELLGYAVVNERTAGTVAPYSGNNANKGDFATFDLSQAAEEASHYEQFTSLNPGFGGNNAGEIDDALPQSDADFTSSDEATYVYERNQDDSSRPAYILIHAKYDGTECYYKLDLVTTDPDTWLTTYLNLYRNFHYQVSINNVTNVGYSTIKEAADAVASNNIGASIEVSEVNTIRDGKDELYVSTTDTLLVTLNQTAKIYYRFAVDVENNPDNVQNDRVNVVEIDVDPNVIRVDKSELGVLKITPKRLPETMESYEFAITVDNSGLSRRVIVRVREPYRFEAVDCDGRIPSEVGETQVLRVRLPQNMPEAVFPLILSIEPKRKTLYPDATVNQLPVNTSGEKYTFTYEGTVVYSNAEETGYLQNPTRFFTFKTNIKDSETFITVTNPYFEDESINFDYDWDTPDKEVPYNVTRFWNDHRYDFWDVSLNIDETDLGDWEALTDENDPNKGTFTFDDADYDPYGNTVTLRFKMHVDGDTYDTPHPAVEIYGNYFNWSNVDTHNGGSYTVRDDGECILYIPDYPEEEQVLTFTINSHYARDDIQITSEDHGTVIATYTNLSRRVQFKYDGRWGESSIRNESITMSINGEDIPIDTDSNGYVENFNRNIIGREPNTVLTFEYHRNRTYYEGSITVEELLKNGSITLKER